MDKYRGPLHGIPWGAKDLLDTAGIATTYGAEPFRGRIPTRDAVVVSRLMKLERCLLPSSAWCSALNDVWFGGQTMNPWLLVEGASGSSAGRVQQRQQGSSAFRLVQRREAALSVRACVAG